MFSELTVDAIKWLVLIASLAFAICMTAIHKKRVWWVLFEGAAAYVILNVSVALYIITHPTNSIWSVDVENRLSAPDLPGGQLIGPITDPLNSFLDGITVTVNDLLATKNALFVAQDFLSAAGVGGLIAVPLFIASLILTRIYRQRSQLRLERRLRAIEGHLGLGDKKTAK